MGNADVTSLAEKVDLYLKTLMRSNYKCWLYDQIRHTVALPHPLNLEKYNL